MKNGAIGDENTPDIRKNKECLINLMGQHFLSRILEVSEDRITVSFPGMDYPASGMGLELQFHDQEGFNCYRSLVVAGPSVLPGAMVIQRPKAMDRVQHRLTCRVSTDLTVQVKEQSLVRKYDASLINLSGGGALLETDAPLDFNSSVKMLISIPRDKTRTVEGRVIHVARPNASQEGEQSIVGVRFIRVEPETERAIADYVWERLRELYPGQ